MTWEDDGAACIRGAAIGVLTELDAKFAAMSVAAGQRLWNIPGLTALLGPNGVLGSHAARILGPGCHPVRAILFDKTANNNWSLGWHQDRTIVVRERRDVPGFGPWTVKRGLLHVAPPIEVLERMVTMRVHLDTVPLENAPLLISPRSHRLGRIAEQDIAATVARCGIATCLASAGDIWLYATPILHASGAAIKPQRRRVLQVDYANAGLPGGLQWFGVGEL